MFTESQRDHVRDQLIDRARDDDRVVSCGLVGSAARDEEDAWSDIDVALNLDQGVDLDALVDDWTTWLTSLTSVVDTFDIHASGALYRVFLCTNTLQIDLSFWPNKSLRSTGEPMRMVFGRADASDLPRQPEHGELIRRGWLFALHARSAIARRRWWQAEMMLADLRNEVVALACLRLGLNPAHGREAHRLPHYLSEALLDSRAPHLDDASLRRSLQSTAELYLTEVSLQDLELATTLTPVIRAIANS